MRGAVGRAGRRSGGDRDQGAGARNAGVDWGALDDVVLGCANQAGEDNRNVARMAALLAGLPTDRLGLDHQPPVRLGPGRRWASPRAPSSRARPN
jgi:hypothetical protein